MSRSLRSWLIIASASVAVALTGCTDDAPEQPEARDGGQRRRRPELRGGGRRLRVGAHGFVCDIDDQGRAVTVMFRTGDNELHGYDPATGAWTAFPAAAEGSRVSVTRTVWIPDLGWLAIGSRVEVEDPEPLVRRSEDLETWQDLAFEGDASLASTTNAAATDDQLFVFGWVNSEPEVWSLPRSELE